MGDIEELRAYASSGLDKIQKRIEELDEKDQISRIKAIKKLGELLKETEGYLQTYEGEANEISGKENKKYLDSLKQMNKRFTSLKQKYESKKIEGTDRERLFKGIFSNSEKPTNEMNQDEIIQRAQELQEDDLERLLTLEGEAEKANDLADQINLQLDEQIKKLDKVDADAKDTQSELNRTTRYIREFLRNIYTDKILMCLIFLIFCAIVTLIVLEFTGYGLNSSTSTKSDIVIKTTSRFLRGENIIINENNLLNDIQIQK